MTLYGLSTHHEVTAVKKSSGDTTVLIRIALIAVGFVAVSLNYFYHDEAHAAFAAATATLLSFYLLVHCRKNWALTIIFLYIFLCVYSFCLVNYANVSLLSPYLQWRHTNISYESVGVMLVFLIGIVLTMPMSVKRFPGDGMLVTPKRENLVISGLCGIIILFCGVFGIGENLGSTSRVLVSSIYEYSIIFFVLGLMYSGKNSRILLFLGAVLAFRVVLDFSLGGRVVAIEFICIWFLMVYSSRASYARIIPLGALVFVIVLFVGVLRGSAFEADAAIEGLRRYVEAGFAWDGAYAAYHTSQSIIAFGHLASPEERLVNLGGFVASLFFGESAGGPSLVQESSHMFWNTGGGYFPFFFHYYAGIPALVVSSILIGLVLRFIAKAGERDYPSDTSLICIVWISVTVFRWFSYSPTPLVRGLLLILFLYIISSLFFRGRGLTDMGPCRESTGKLL